MPIVTVATSGTEVPLVAATALPVDRLCARVSLEWLAANTGSIFVGLPKPLGVGSGVTTTNYDVVLNSTNNSYTIGLGNECNTVDLTTVFIDAGTSGDSVAVSPEQV